MAKKLVQVAYGEHDAAAFMRCWRCQGRGRILETGPERCPTCSGDGRDPDPATYTYEGPDDLSVGEVVVCPVTTRRGGDEEIVGTVVLLGSPYDGPVKAVRRR